MSPIYQNLSETVQAGAEQHILPAAFHAGMAASELTPLVVAAGSPAAIQRLTGADRRRTPPFRFRSAFE
jgi:hypothetical protein